MANLKELLEESFEELTETTRLRDEYEIEYELEKARTIFSAEVSALSNQTQRDAQVTILLEEKDMLRRMAELRTEAKIAYYKWSTIKTLMENKWNY